MSGMSGMRDLSAESLIRFERELPSFRAALAGLLEDGRHEGALRLGAALWRFWLNRAQYHDAAEWLERAPSTTRLSRWTCARPHSGPRAESPSTCTTTSTSGEVLAGRARTAPRAGRSARARCCVQPAGQRRVAPRRLRRCDRLPQAGAAAVRAGRRRGLTPDRAPLAGRGVPRPRRLRGWRARARRDGDARTRARLRPTADKHVAQPRGPLARSFGSRRGAAPLCRSARVRRRDWKPARADLLRRRHRVRAAPAGRRRARPRASGESRRTRNAGSASGCS